MVPMESLSAKLITGSKILNGFQNTRGYSPYILCIPRKIVPKEPIDAHLDHEALRVVERMMKSNTKILIDNTLLMVGRNVLFYRESSKLNDPNELVEATIDNMEEHIITCRRNTKGLPAKWFLLLHHMSLMSHVKTSSNESFAWGHKTHLYGCANLRTNYERVI